VNLILSRSFFFFRFLLSRAAFFYLVLGLLSFALVDYKRIAFTYKIRVLNTIMPHSLRFMVDTVERGGPRIETSSPRGGQAPSGEMTRAIGFYARVADFFPEQADAWGMLGFCFYHTGQTAKSYAAYQKALELNSEVFWYHYNLGVLNYNFGEFAKARQHFQNALKLAPLPTLQFIDGSKVIYRSIMIDAGLTGKDLQQRLGEGYRNTAALARDCDARLNSPQLRNKPIVRQGIRIF